MKRIANYLIALAVMAFTFTSCEDVPSPFGDIVKPAGDDVISIDPTGSGTETDPYNVAAVLEYVSGLAADAESPTEVYIKGIIYEVKEVDTSGNYGNATYFISDDEEGKANSFQIYRGFGLGGQKFNAGATPVKTGDKVIIKSKVTNFRGNTPETVQNNCIIVELNGTKASGSTTPTETLGTKDAPITVAKALEYISALADNGTTDADAYVKGKITQIKTSDANIAQHKNIDYIISDGTNELTVFHGKNIDNTDFTAAGQINVGDEVVVFGKLTKYVKDGKTTPEVAQGNYIVSLTKGTGGGSDTPSGSAYFEESFANGQGGFTVEDKVFSNIWTSASYQNDTYMKASSYQNSKNNDGESWLISPEVDLTNAKSPVLTFAEVINAYFGNVDDEAMVYAKKSGGEWKKLSYTHIAKPAKGYTKFTDDGANITISLKDYIGGKMQFAFVYKGTSTTAGTWEVKDVKVAEGEGGNTGGGASGGASGNSITINMSSLGVTNGNEMGSQTLSDGTVLAFDKGDNGNAPKYYDSGSAVRMYPTNTVTVTASKKIASIQLTCSANNAEGNVKATPGNVEVNEMNITISGINSTATTITNTHTGTGAVSQLRIASMVITYAN